MEANNDPDQLPRQKSHRSRRSRHMSHSSLKVWVLLLALVAAIVVNFVTFVHSSSRIDKLTGRADTTQEQLFRMQQENSELKSDLKHARNELEKILSGRLPSVMKLEADQVLAINKGFLKNIVFSVVTQDGVKSHEYKLLLENLSHGNVVPKFRVLVFDKYGVQIGIDQVLTGDELAPGESRSYSSKVNFFMHEEPAYFNVSSLIPPEAKRIQSLLEFDG